MHLPEIDQWQSLWQQNLEIIGGQSSNPSQIQTFSLAAIRKTGRAEIIQLATEFTRQYRDVELGDRNANQVLMAGHQPALFHAGVWYKNFVLSSLGTQLNCLPINLIVDNDICHGAFVNVPGANERLERIHYDSRSSIVPYEARAIADREMFASFAKTAADAVGKWVRDPIVEPLWQRVLENGSNNLGLAIAAGRHRYEQDLAMHSLELPVSAVAQTASFAALFREIVTRFEPFHQIYNATIRAYRQLHKIKNTSHPVPELKVTDGWFETPFWIWTLDSPARRNLFVRADRDSEGAFEISDREQTTRLIPGSADAADLVAILTDGICVRPKALVTTLYSRLIASDMFIHGIGGSKYDQLTDEIARQFLGIEMPGYLTISGTFKIQNAIPPVFDTDISSRQNQLRQMRFHPELFIESAADDAQSQQLVQEKRAWVAQDLPVGQRLSRHQAITGINGRLQNHIGDRQNALEQQIGDLREKQTLAQLLNSREYSFCLLDRKLPAELQQLCRFQ